MGRGNRGRRIGDPVGGSIRVRREVVKKKRREFLYMVALALFSLIIASVFLYFNGNIQAILDFIHYLIKSNLFFLFEW